MLNEPRAKASPKGTNAIGEPTPKTRPCPPRPPAPAGKAVASAQSAPPSNNKTSKTFCYLTPTSIFVIFSFRAGPRGTATETISLRRCPSSARPTGDSLESLFSVGLASAEPTIV
jgi:hypothetical protein